MVTWARLPQHAIGSSPQVIEHDVVRQPHEIPRLKRLQEFDEIGFLYVAKFDFDGNLLWQRD
jgi:hypothetical protein